MSDQKTLMEFPTQFPIKVMGRHDGDVRTLARAIIEKHAGPIAEESIKTRTSADGNFVALTYQVLASSREQLDAIYGELTSCKAVLMAL